MRMWDERTAHGVDHFIANSDFIARRIDKVYRRKAEVIYPPVDTKAFARCDEKGDFYLTASRMVPYKRVPLLVEAFAATPQRKLVVIGDGPEWHRVKAVAGPNVELLGYQPAEVLRDYMQRAKAFVFAAEEDFGITPVEAQACGTPVIAYGRGGALETVLGVDSHDAPTGVFFGEQTVDSIRGAVDRFEQEQHRFSSHRCAENAERFSVEEFGRRLCDFVQSARIADSAASNSRVSSRSFEQATGVFALPLTNESTFSSKVVKIA
jgi:glycosyltransferase involved in cell wall biosynthesis